MEQSTSCGRRGRTRSQREAQALHGAGAAVLHQHIGLQRERARHFRSARSFRSSAIERLPRFRLAKFSL
jgi:hypothetical protein